MQLAHREHRLRQLRLVQAVQEVALVLARIQALEQLVAAGGLVQAHARVVAGGDAFRAEAHRVVEEGLELDLGVAQHVGVGRTAGAVLAQELGEDAILVFGREVHVLDVDVQHVGHAGGVQEVLARRAVLVIVVVFPVLHEDADDLVPLLLEQVGRHRRIDTAGQADHHTLRTHAPIVGNGGSSCLGKGSYFGSEVMLPMSGVATLGCVKIVSSGRRLPAR